MDKAAKDTGTVKAPKKQKALVKDENAGAAANTVASSPAVQEEPARQLKAATPVRGKFLKKNKSRMPRRQKKALRKAEMRAQAG
jgi:hypothetical protein